MSTTFLLLLGPDRNVYVTRGTLVSIIIVVFFGPGVSDQPETSTTVSSIFQRPVIFFFFFFFFFNLETAITNYIPVRGFKSDYSVLLGYSLPVSLSPLFRLELSPYCLAPKSLPPGGPALRGVPRYRVLPCQGLSSPGWRPRPHPRYGLHCGYALTSFDDSSSAKYVLGPTRAFPEPPILG